MNKQGELILTSDNFFDSIEFQKKSELEQVSYILFYVTEVAHLRKDMIPEIIADRIRDQYESFFQRNPTVNKDIYVQLKAERVKEILDQNTEWFEKSNCGIVSGSDRSPKMKKTPYVLTEKKKDELWKKFNKDIKSKISLQKKRWLLDGTLSAILFVCITGLALVELIHFCVKDDELVVTSIQDYGNKINLEEYNPTKKSVLFVYYVTELTKMREVVNATAIHDRLVDLNYDMPPQEELDKLLDRSDMFKCNEKEPKAYSLTNLGIDYAEDVVNSHIQKYNIPWKTILGFAIPILVALFSFFGGMMKLAYSLGKQQ